MPIDELLRFLTRALRQENHAGICVALGLDPLHHNPVLSIVEDWHRGGAETFILIFQLAVGGVSKKYILKACVPFSPAVSIDLVLSKWLVRRRIIEDAGCLAPRVYGTHEATLIEEYISYQLADISSTLWTASLTRDLLHYAEVLRTQRFHALAPFSDLRTDGTRVYVVDFGEDLGDPGAVLIPSDYTAIAVRWLHDRGVA